MLVTKTHQLGFTLIELLVAIAVFAILVSAGAPSFKSWVQNSQIRTAAESISSGLQLARAQAVRRNASVQFSLTGTANVNSTWTVGCVVPVADLDGDGVDDCPAVIQSRSGTEGTTNAVISSTQASIRFFGTGRSNLPMTININNTTGGDCSPAGPMRCLRVLVSTGGQVRMCNPALPSSNPQGC